MKHFLILILLSALSRSGTGQERGQSDTASPARARQLREVIIRGQKPPVQQNSEGAVVNVQSSILNKGSSVLEVMERSPGITLDRRNNGIRLNGRSGVTVLIDGKVQHLPEEELMALLGGLSADNVEKIELLTTPSARYDASGSAGIINIVLKKNRRPGTNGSLSLNGGYGWREKGGGSVNLEHNTGLTDWYGSYSFRRDHSYGGFIATGTNNNPAIGPSAFRFHDSTARISNDHGLLAGIEIKGRRGVTLGASLNYHNSATHTASSNHGRYTIPPDSVLAFDGIIHGQSHWDNVIASLTVEKEMRKGEKLGLGLDWLGYTNDRPSEVQGSFVDPHGETVGVRGDSLFATANKGYSGTRIRVGVFRADYSRTLGTKWRIEAGIKGDYTRSHSESGIESLINGSWVTSAASTNAIRMQEGIAAGYAAVHAALDASTTLDMGLRYEYSDTKLDDAGTGAPIVRRRMGVFFPSLLLSRKAGAGEWQLSYTKRITRPSYKDLSSFISYNDPFSVFTGNPLLKPTVTRNVRLGYSTHGYAFSLLFSHDQDPIFGWALTTQPGSQLVYIRPENLSFQNSLSLDMNLPFSIGNWWTMSYGFNGGWRQYRVPYIPVPVVKGWFGYSVNFQENWKLPARFAVQLSGWFNGVSYESISRSGTVGEINLGVKKELNRGSLQFSITDLFRMVNYKSYVGEVANDGFDTHTYISYDTETRRVPVFRISYSLSFGTGAAAPKTERAGEEKARIK
jgi:hypothetical protein